MKEPKRTDDKYWKGTRDFNHIQYESDLEDYIIDLKNEIQQLRKHAIMRWVSVKDALPTKDGQYCTYLKTGKYDSIGFTQFLDGQFASSFITHWMDVVKPCT